MYSTGTEPSARGCRALIAFDQRLDLVALVLVGSDIGAARHSDLNERAPLGGQQPLVKSSPNARKPLRDPLGVVEAVDAEEDRFDLELLVGARGLLAASSPERVPMGEVDGDRERIDIDGVSSVEQRVPADAASTSRSAAATKLSTSSATWKPNDVGAEHPLITSLRHGSIENNCAFGNGMCKNNPMRRSGRLARIMAGASSRW